MASEKISLLTASLEKLNAKQNAIAKKREILFGHFEKSIFAAGEASDKVMEAKNKAAAEKTALRESIALFRERKRDVQKASEKEAIEKAEKAHKSVVQKAGNVTKSRMAVIEARKKEDIAYEKAGKRGGAVTWTEAEKRRSEYNKTKEEDLLKTPFGDRERMLKKRRAELIEEQRKQGSSKHIQMALSENQRRLEHVRDMRSELIHLDKTIPQRQERLAKREATFSEWRSGSQTAIDNARKELGDFDRKGRKDGYINLNKRASIEREIIRLEKDFESENSRIYRDILTERKGIRNATIRQRQLVELWNPGNKPVGPSSSSKTSPVTYPLPPVSQLRDTETGMKGVTTAVKGTETAMKGLTIGSRLAGAAMGFVKTVFAMSLFGAALTAVSMITGGIISWYTNTKKLKDETGLLVEKYRQMADEKQRAEKDQEIQTENKINEARTLDRKFEILKMPGLQGKTLSDVDFNHVKTIKNDLEEAFGDLGISIDENSKSFRLSSGTLERFNSAMSGFLAAQLEKELSQKREVLTKLEKEREDIIKKHVDTAIMYLSMGSDHYPDEYALRKDVIERLEAGELDASKYAGAKAMVAIAQSDVDDLVKRINAFNINKELGKDVQITGDYTPDMDTDWDERRKENEKEIAKLQEKNARDRMSQLENEIEDINKLGNVTREFYDRQLEKADRAWQKVFDIENRIKSNERAIQRVRVERGFVEADDRGIFNKDKEFNRLDKEIKKYREEIELYNEDLKKANEGLGVAEGILKQIGDDVAVFAKIQEEALQNLVEKTKEKYKEPSESDMQSRAISMMLLDMNKELAKGDLADMNFVTNLANAIAAANIDLESKQLEEAATALKEAAQKLKEATEKYDAVNAGDDLASTAQALEDMIAAQDDEKRKRHDFMSMQEEANRKRKEKEKKKGETTPELDDLRKQLAQARLSGIPEQIKEAERQIQLRDIWDNAYRLQSALKDLDNAESMYKRAKNLGIADDSMLEVLDMNRIVAGNEVDKLSEKRAQLLNSLQDGLKETTNFTSVGTFSHLGSALGANDIGIRQLEFLKKIERNTGAGQRFQ